jgi:hypothetical protein
MGATSVQALREGPAADGADPTENESAFDRATKLTIDATREYVILNLLLFEAVEADGRVWEDDDGEVS